MLNWPLCASLSSPALDARCHDVHVCRCYIELDEGGGSLM